MTFQKLMDLALAYFTYSEHTSPFELLKGQGRVFLSAPHATQHTRNGIVKPAERYTGMLCLMLHEHLNCPVIYKTRHMEDDANYDPANDYRDAACGYIQRNNICCLLDLHQLSPQRSMDLCICTGKRRNLCGQNELVSMIRQCFMDQGICRITVDSPFNSGSPHTVSSTVSRRCAIPAVQLELNSRLVLNGYREECYSKVFAALSAFVALLNDITLSCGSKT